MKRGRVESAIACELFYRPYCFAAGTPLWSASLRGGGTARAFFGADISGGSGPRLVPNDLHSMFEPQPVPEPSTLFLVASGLAAALTRCRRRSALSDRGGFEERPGPTSPSLTGRRGEHQQRRVQSPAEEFDARREDGV